MKGFQNKALSDSVLEDEPPGQSPGIYGPETSLAALVPEGLAAEGQFYSLERPRAGRLQRRSDLHSVIQH